MSTILHTSGLMGMVYDDMILYDDIDTTYHDRFLGNLKNARLKAGRSAVLNALKKLTEENIIVKCGVGRGTYYVRSDAFRKQ